MFSLVVRLATTRKQCMPVRPNTDQMATSINASSTAEAGVSWTPLTKVPSFDAGRKIKNGFYFFSLTKSNVREEATAGVGNQCRQ